jgi:hypothetical protein
VQASAINITQMVKRMGISRSTYYNHCQQPNLSLEKLAQYGQVIKHDFSVELPEMKQYSVEEAEVPYIIPKTMDEAMAQRDYWRERYYGLLERFHKEVGKG